MTFEELKKLFINDDSDSILEFVKKYFNDDMEIFIEFIEKRNILDNEEIYNFFIEQTPMTYLKKKYNENSEKTIKFIVDNYLNDVKEENGKYLMRMSKREDLSIFFDDRGRDTTARDVAKRVLSEDWWEPFDDTTDDVYRDVIEELNDDNLKHLSDYIVESLKDSQIEVETDVLNSIAENQGTTYVTIDIDNVMEIINDEETMKLLMDNELDELKSELYSLHHSSYNGAYNGEKWEDITNSIKNFLGTSDIGNEVSREIKLPPDGKTKTVYDFYVDVTNILNDVVQVAFDMGDYRNEFEYHGDLETILSDYISSGDMEGASYSVPYYDYADSKLVTENINESFKDYI
jgi:hypothetical protein